MTPEAAAAILGVTLDVTRQGLAEAYRRRARETHPDRLEGILPHEARAAGREFVAVTEARDVLSAYLDERGRPDEPVREDKRPARPMTFGEFVVWREDAAWGPTPQWDRRAEPAAMRTRRWAGESLARDARTRLVDVVRRVLRRLRGVFARRG